MWAQGRGKWAKIEVQVGVAGMTSWSDEVMVRPVLYLGLSYMRYGTCLSVSFFLVEVAYRQYSLLQWCLDSFVLFSLMNCYSSVFGCLFSVSGNLHLLAMEIFLQSLLS